MNIIEGFYIKLRTGDIFTVKGTYNLNRFVIAYPKYVKSIYGDRISKNGTRYLKLSSFSKQLAYLKTAYRCYINFDYYLGFEIPRIPINEIEFIYNPIEKIRSILKKNHQTEVVKEFINLLYKCFEVEKVGISGSYLIDLQTESSDIDIVIYNASRESYEKFCSLVKDVLYKDRKYLEIVYRERVQELPIPFDKYVLLEKRRYLEGMYKNTRFFLRLVNTELDNYNKFIRRRFGVGVYKIEIIDNEYAIYTPCIYKVKVLDIISGKKLPITELFSYRGRFCEIGYPGDKFIVKGVIEKVIDLKSSNSWFRISLDYPNSYMIFKM